jgi:hypothetical protein
VDWTGFSTIKYASWYDAKYKAARRCARLVKAHFATGAKTNVVTAVEIHDQDALPPALECRVNGYAKFVCHNVCVLVTEMYTLRIQAIFDGPGGCTNTSGPPQILRFPR